MEIAGLVLDYIKVLLSPAVIGGVLLLVFVRMFRPEIAKLIERIARIRFPGGSVETSQAERLEKEPPVRLQPTATVAASAVTLPTPLTPEAVEDLVRTERAAATEWEFRYLDYFLVHDAHEVLAWLVERPSPPSLDLYNSYWQSSIPKPNERSAIFEALESHGLIALHDGRIEVTAKGRAYREWRRLFYAAVGRALADFAK